jgi:hypothetical protein
MCPLGPLTGHVPQTSPATFTIIYVFGLGQPITPTFEVFQVSLAWAKPSTEASGRRVQAAGQNNRIAAPASKTKPNNGTMYQRNRRCPTPTTISDLNIRFAREARTITRQP